MDRPNPVANNNLTPATSLAIAGTAMLDFHA
jgi:hypothetical protein